MSYRAIYDGRIIAEATDDAVKRIEGNVYFPPDSVRQKYLQDSNRHSRCYWKGRASYFHVVGKSGVAPDAAFSYPKPWPLAKNLKDYVAFWRGVRVERR